MLRVRVRQRPVCACEKAPPFECLDYECGLVIVGITKRPDMRIDVYRYPPGMCRQRRGVSLGKPEVEATAPPNSYATTPVAASAAMAPVAAMTTATVAAASATVATAVTTTVATTVTTTVATVAAAPHEFNSGDAGSSLSKT